jgi:D-xylose 1-dehydrogenase (NADP+, D-xylono-1,5-lactone-forming)
VTLRWGLMSTARINRRVLAGAALSDRAEVVAVGGRDAAVTQAYARAHGIERAHPGYDDLLADPEVDAVYISLPNSMHVEWSIRALEAGKHVLVEKPFSPHPDDVEEAFDVAEREGLVLSEAFMWRHQPQTHELLRLVRGGAVGRLRLVRAQFSFRLAATADVRLDPQLDGGALMDVGSYCVNAIRAIAGEPLSLGGEQALGPTGVDVSFTGAARCPDDVLAHFDCGFVMPYRGGIEVAGEDGVIVVRDPWHVTEPGIELHREDGFEQIDEPRADAYQLELENIADAVSGAAPLLLGRDDAIGQARTIDGLYRSANS